jgi:UDP:flavonoid glycosyltransferase YjiC (YdhE family)
VKDEVEKQGFKFLQLDEINFEPAPSISNKGKLSRFIHKLINYKKRREVAIDSLGMQQFMKQIEKLDADLFIVDIELHEHIMTLIKSDKKVLLLSQWFSTWKRKGLPPILEDTIPGIGFNGSNLGFQLAWKRVELKRWKIFFKKKINSVWTDRRSVLQAYAKKIGFSKKYIPENYWPGPFSYDLLPVISMTQKELDFPHDIRPNMEYVGAMVYGGRIEQAHGNEIDYSELKNEGSKLIYCSVSTFKGGDIRFLKKLIKALEDKSNLNLVISLGGLISKEELGNLPNNVFVYTKVNQLRILELADLSINHGGIHTINECIHFKVPMLIYSGKRSDQSGCAARVHFHGVGLMADKDLDSSEEMLMKIEEVLSSQTIQQKLDEFNNLNLSYQSENKLGKVIKSLLESDKQEVMQLEERF